MKNGAGGKRNLDEGRLVAAALGLALILCLGIWVNRQPRSMSVAPVHSVCVQAVEEAVQVDLNAADVEELMRLPGIGEVLAQRIVEDRSAHGRFESIEDLMRVKGIGEGKLEALRPHARVD